MRSSLLILDLKQDKLYCCKFLNLLRSSICLNTYNVRIVRESGRFSYQFCRTPAKWKKYKPETPMDSLTEEEKELTVENDSGMGTDEGAKEGGQESNSVKKENDAENAKKAAEQQATVFIGDNKIN